jgi:glycosyltransferase involved in cell wall biosynthesis
MPVADAALLGEAIRIFLYSKLFMLAHVCILSALHPPDDGRVTHKIGRGLRAAGMRVSWIGPGKAPPFDDHGIEFQLLPYSKGWVARYLRRRALEKAALQLRHVDVWFAVEPDSAMVANKLASSYGGRAVFDIHEVYHDDMLKERVPRLLKPIIGALVKWKLTEICRRADLIVGAGFTRLEPFLSVARSSLVVRHCLSRELGGEQAATPFDGSHDFVRILHGKATLSHGTRQILEAAAIVQRKHGLKIRLVLFKCFNAAERFGLKEAIVLAEQLGVSHVIEWLDPVPFHKMFEIMRKCDLGVIAYTRKMGVNCMPNRIFEYMALGIPVICPSYAREMVPIVEATKCGILTNTENGELLAEAIKLICGNRNEARQMGMRGRRSFLEVMNMEKELEPFVNWVVTNGRGKSGA